MAKDPAFLFYPGDYVAGTMHLDFECKGAYMDLLMLQFQKNHMSIHMIKQVLGHKFDHIWPLILDKFAEKDGLFWNERLKIEKEKRVKFCKSRENNRNGISKEDSHMSSHMENENENINTDLLKKYKKNGERLKGWKFDETKEGVYMPTGRYQKLGQDQKFLADRGELSPNAITEGVIY